ncbi:MAG: serine acetyltransferase [Deltaproteobacteria bacterium]|nr:serine acetyltransferase [Deltaproteobacteria bacterium]
MTDGIPDRPRDGNRLEATIAALSTSNGDALSKAAAEGIPEWEDVVAWSDRILRLVLHRRERAVLEAELPDLVHWLRRILARLSLPAGVDAETVVSVFVARLPRVRAAIAEDVEAAFEGDPAARSYAEIVAAYPAVRAIATHRVAHELCALGVPLVPRIMAEHAHARTGIDIHPGAKIGRRFFVDHGTGVVIGETAEIGDRVVLYQGVTLGAKAPRAGQVLRGVKRHPTIEDDVTIYAGATILGGETVIGRGSVIGGNVWLTHSVPPCSKVQIEAHLQLQRDQDCSEQPDQLHWDI